MIAAASRVTPKGYFWLSLGAGVVIGSGAIALRAVNDTPVVASANPASPGQAAGGNGGGNANGQGNGNTAKGKAFTMSGSATGLYPGADLPLQLTVQNPNQQDIRVQSVSVQVANATAQCPGSLVTVDSFAPFVVGGRASGVTTLQIHLSPSAPNVCRARTWTLTYTGTAVMA